MIRATLLLTAVLVAAPPAAPPAVACPVCDTATGEQVRAGILDQSFAYHVGLTLLPFPFLIGIAALIHFGPPRRK